MGLSLHRGRRRARPSPPGLQRFLWYALPRKWLVPLDAQLDVASSLATFLDRCEEGDRGSEYAALCRSVDTKELLSLYDRDEDAAVERFLSLEAATGIEPPSTETLSWGGVMGIEEAALRDQAASVLELGDIQVGKRGWRKKQKQVLDRFLTMPRDDLDGLAPIEQIRKRAGRKLAQLAPRGP